MCCEAYGLRSGAFCRKTRFVVVCFCYCLFYSHSDTLLFAFLFVFVLVTLARFVAFCNADTFCPRMVTNVLNLMFLPTRSVVEW